jgi:hypothetical protein
MWPFRKKARESTTGGKASPTGQKNVGNTGSPNPLSRHSVNEDATPASGSSSNLKVCAANEPGKKQLSSDSPATPHSVSEKPILLGDEFLKPVDPALMTAPFHQTGQSSDPLPPEIPPPYELGEINFRISYFTAGAYASSETGAGEPTMQPSTGELLAEPLSPPAPLDVSSYLVTRTPSFGQDAFSNPPGGALLTVDPVLAGVFLTRAESDPRVPRAATWAYLEDPAVLAPASRLLSRVVQNWSNGGRPLKREDLLAMARDIVDDPPTALLICHNVIRAFAHYSVALRWHLLDPLRAEYTDGSSIYIAKTNHPDDSLGPPENPIFFALFAGADLPISEPSRWTRHFALAVATAFAASSRLGSSGALVTKFALAFTDALESATRRMIDLSQPPRADYRAWLWADALSFVELAGFERPAPELLAEARTDLRACAFGLIHTRTALNPNWRWHSPSKGTPLFVPANQPAPSPLVLDPAQELESHTGG